MTNEEMASVERLAQMLVGKVETLLKPMDIVMSVEKWDPEYRRIMWAAVAAAATRRAEVA